MIPFRTTVDQFVKLQTIIENLTNEGSFNDEFLTNVYCIATFDQGMYELLEMLMDETNVEERDLTLLEIEKTIKDWK